MNPWTADNRHTTTTFDLSAPNRLMYVFICQILVQGPTRAHKHLGAESPCLSLHCLHRLRENCMSCRTSEFLACEVIWTLRLQAPIGPPIANITHSLSFGFDFLALLMLLCWTTNEQGECREKGSMKGIAFSAFTVLPPIAAVIRTTTRFHFNSKDLELKWKF